MSEFVPALHSPAPWTEFQDADSHDIIDKNGDHVCTIEPVNGLHPETQQVANAQLIKSAPQLLVVCQRLLTRAYQAKRLSKADMLELEAVIAEAYVY